MLDGTHAGTRMVVKACMDQTMLTKLPVAGQLNVANQAEIL